MKVLAIFAHPNDEVCWGFPYLQNPQNECFVYIVSSWHMDEQDRSEEALAAVGEMEGWQTVLGKIMPEFYRAATDNLQMPNLVQIVQMIRHGIRVICDQFQPDAVITHNPLGEDGNPDHRLVSEIVLGTMMQLGVANPAYTDVCIPSPRYASYHQIPHYFWDGYYRNCKDKYQLNPKFYDRCRNVYEGMGQWKYDGPIAQQAGLYEVCG